MNSIQSKYVIGWLLVLLFPLFVFSCSDAEDELSEDVDSDYESEISSIQVAYSIAVGNFYKGNEPSKGMVLNIEKPTERSVACESYELALRDFEINLPSNQENEVFISRNKDDVTLNLDEFGYVKFYRTSSEGIVARTDISLKNVPKYSILYRMEASFGDNYSSDISLNELFNPGDAVYFPCPLSVRNSVRLEDGEWPKWKWQTCEEPCNGLVVEACSDRIYVFTCHTHSYMLQDYWKGGNWFYCDVVSEGDWKRIYNSWHKNPQSFRRTDDNYRTVESITLRNLMEGFDESPHKYVCVNGNDQDIHKTKYWAHKTWYSWAYRINKSDLRNGVFNVSRAKFAYRNKWKDPDCDYYYMLIEINRNQADKVKKVYPKN